MGTNRADHVVILMGLYNGGPHIEDQLASLAAQDHGSWSLIISDDGSQDDGLQKVQRFADGPGKGRVTLTRGPQQGFARNFLSLLAHPQTGDADVVALCDQDDVWLPQKLSRGLAALRGQEDGATLYCARSVICDARLKPLSLSPLWQRPFTLRNALVQNVASGTTIMLNKAMADRARAAAPAAQAARIAAHDWWLYQLATASGAMVLQDDQPVVHYRQHGRNLMGRNDTVSARAGRVAQILDGTFARWIDANQRALLAVPDLLTPEARALLAQLPGLRAPRPRQRIAALRAMGLYRQSATGDRALLAAAALARL